MRASVFTEGSLVRASVFTEGSLVRVCVLIEGRLMRASMSLQLTGNSVASETDVSVPFQKAVW